MSFLIPSDKFGTKQKKPKLIPEVRKAIRESKQHKPHTIKDVRKNRQKMEQQAAIRIKNIQNLVLEFGLLEDSSINLLAAKTVQRNLFDNTFTAKLFIINFKDKIFS